MYLMIYQAFLETTSSMQDSSVAKATRDIKLSVREALSLKKEQSQKDSEAEFVNDSGDDDDDNGDNNSDDNDASFDARMRQQVLRKRKELGDIPSKQKQNERSVPSASQTSARGSSPGSMDDEQPKLEKLSLKKKGIGSDARAERMANADADLQLMGEAERGRMLQKQKKRRLQGREDEVLAKLEKFKKTISAKAIASNSESGRAGREDLSDWSTVRLKFEPESGKDGMSRKDDPNDYVVYDPLVEKGKEKFNRMQAKQKRREREWAGKSLT
uniref:Uncharacterized protein MANES_03G050500 n=1 Tax=Rhizophora mucronata TaxID=61149 RepID=A0A2P2K2L6_RHIMU